MEVESKFYLMVLFEAFFDAAIGLGLLTILYVAHAVPLQIFSAKAVVVVAAFMFLKTLVWAALQAMMEGIGSSEEPQ